MSIVTGIGNNSMAEWRRRAELIAELTRKNLESGMGKTNAQVAAHSEANRIAQMERMKGQ